MKRRWQRCPPVSDIDWSYPETSRLVDALVKSAFYAATNGKSGGKDDGQATSYQEREQDEQQI